MSNGARRAGLLRWEMVMAKVKREEYAAKFRDPRWQQLRLRILERDGFACVYCSDKSKTLHVHHKMYYYGRDPWDYPPSLLITLCESCHEYESVEGKDADVQIREALAIYSASPEDKWALAAALAAWAQVDQLEHVICAMNDLFKGGGLKALMERYWSFSPRDPGVLPLVEMLRSGEKGAADGTARAEQ